MGMRRALAMLVATMPLSACVTPPDTATVFASARGTGADDAYVVSGVGQEFEILRLLGVTMDSHARHVINGRSFDVLSVRDPATSATRDVWFDISRIIGRGY